MLLSPFLICLPVLAIPTRLESTVYHGITSMFMVLAPVTIMLISFVFGTISAVHYFFRAGSVIGLPEMFTFWPRFFFALTNSSPVFQVARL